ncbi:MAG: transposase [Nanoarchaeota archaeon]
MKNIEYYDYLKFIDDALELAKSIPRYFSKFSNKVYCNHQKFAIIILMQKLKTTTRGIVSYLRSNSDARMHLGLNKVPVHTTIVRFARRIKNMIHKVLEIRQAQIVAVDATGFELESKSYYYRRIWNSNNKQKAKKYMKLSIAIDAKKQIILSTKTRLSPRNDTIDFKELLKNLKVDYVVADKGYSSKSNRRFVLNKLKSHPMIPYKKTEGVYRINNGRKKLEFDDKIYHQRSKVESVFSSIKRKYGSVLRGKSFDVQHVEAISKAIAHNVDRMQRCILLLIRGLHQSSF